jgi:hypothetical protein
MLYDVFICHASEDKDPFVRPLAEALRAEHVEVWYDEFSLVLGDSIRQSIDKGLRQARFGVIVLSKAFFAKRWTQYELDGLTEREMHGNDTVLLPLWHEVEHADVFAYSPSLAGRKAVRSSLGLAAVLKAILAVIRPQGSPLVRARDVLIDRGIRPPVITDEYWLDVVEASNRVPGYGATIPEETEWGRWSFPLPPRGGGPHERGDRLAWTAMQMRWVEAAERTSISPLTRPDEVLDFIDAHPGLFETCEEFPELLAEYAPQLTIPGFGGELEPTLEAAYRASSGKAAQRRRSAAHELTPGGDEQQSLCDTVWALRHPLFGNHPASYIANAYFSGEIFGPTVSPYEHAEHLFWLLSSASDWLPRHVHDKLLEGMADWGVWIWTDGKHGDDEITRDALLNSMAAAQDGKSFVWSEAAKEDTMRRIRFAIDTLQLPDSPEAIFERFMNYNFPAKRMAARHARS